MTPKEKAQYLVHSFYLCMPFKDTKLTSCDESKDLIFKMELLAAKQCATIAVDETLYAISEDNTYWEEVKLEIQKL